MRFSVLLCLLSFSALLQACSTPSGGGAGGTANFGEYDLKWSNLPVMQSNVPKGTTPLIFTFSSSRPSNNNGVTEADWERRAAKSGMAVSDLKSLFGGSAYKGPDGELRMCTIAAIQKGFCKTNFRMSIAQRTDLAQRALAADSRCQWIGFDPSYHRTAARMLGAEDFTLHVAASCR